MFFFFKRLKLNKSFTITELSVVIAVTGILLSGAIGGIQSTAENAKIKQDNLEINQIAQAIDSFFVKNKYIPCPADPTLLESNSNYGIGDLTLGKKGYGFNNNEDAEVGFIFGTIPVKDLGLDLNLIYDKWNHKRTYMVYAPLCIPIGNNIGTTGMVKEGYEVLKTDTPSQIATKKLSTVKNYYSILGKTGSGASEVKKYFIPVNAKITSSSGNVLFDSENNIGYLITRHGSKIENCAWKRDGKRESESSTFSLLTTEDNAPSEAKNCFRYWLGNNISSSTGLPSQTQYIKDSGIYSFSNSNNAADKPLNFISDKGMNFFVGTIDKLMVNSQKIAEFSKNQNIVGNYITDDGAIPMRDNLMGPSPVKWNIAARDFVQKGFVNMFDIIASINPIETSGIHKIYKDQGIMIEVKSQADQTKRITIVNLDNNFDNKNIKYKAIIYDPPKFNSDGNITKDTAGYVNEDWWRASSNSFFLFEKECNVKVTSVGSSNCTEIVDSPKSVFQPNKHGAMFLSIENITNQKSWEFAIRYTSNNEIFLRLISYKDNPTLPNINGLVAGNYPNSIQSGIIKIPSFTIDSKGRVTSASTYDATADIKKMIDDAINADNKTEEDTYQKIIKNTLPAGFIFTFDDRAITSLDSYNLYLANGQNQTTDLRNYYLKAKTSAQTVGDKLPVQMPPHSHILNTVDNTHTHPNVITSSDGGHVHTLDNSRANYGNFSTTTISTFIRKYGGTITLSAIPSHAHSATQTASGTHSHNILYQNSTTEPITNITTNEFIPKSYGVNFFQQTASSDVKIPKGAIIMTFDSIIPENWESVNAANNRFLGFFGINATVGQSYFDGIINHHHLISDQPQNHTHTLTIFESGGHSHSFTGQFFDSSVLYRSNSSTVAFNGWGGAKGNPLKTNHTPHSHNGKSMNGEFYHLHNMSGTNEPHPKYFNVSFIRNTLNDNTCIPYGSIIPYLGKDTPDGWIDITGNFAGYFPRGASTALSQKFDENRSHTHKISYTNSVHSHNIQLNEVTMGEHNFISYLYNGESASTDLGSFAFFTTTNSSDNSHTHSINFQNATDWHTHTVNNSTVTPTATEIAPQSIAVRFLKRSIQCFDIQPSDRTLKKNISKIKNSTSLINKLKVKKYKWIDEKRFDNKEHIGFIAQEVEKVLPELIHQDGKIKKVDYNSIFSLSIDAIKNINFAIIILFTLVLIMIIWIIILSCKLNKILKRKNIDN